jgi:hypothetical protein
MGFPGRYSDIAFGCGILGPSPIFVPFKIILMETVRAYFNAEKNESVLFIIAGVAAMLAGFYFLLILKGPFFNGMAIPLLIVGVIQLTVGGIIYFRSPSDFERVAQYISSDRAKIESEEIPRMKAVMKSFIVYRYVEIALLILSICLILASAKNEFMKGAGIGLFIQAALMLVFDFFAERRGEEYYRFLEQLMKG